MKQIKRIKKKNGFTLIELVVVIAILAVLALILVPAISGYVSKAEDSKNQANAKSVYTAAMVIDSDNKTKLKSSETSTTNLAFKTALDSILVLDETTTYLVKKEVDDKVSVDIFIANKLVASYPEKSLSPVLPD